MEKRPYILVLEDRDSHFGSHLWKELHGAFSVLSFHQNYPFLRKIGEVLEKGEEIRALVLYHTLPPYSFLALWEFLVHKLQLQETPIYYYYDKVLHVVKGGRRLYCIPLLKINDRDLQVGFILDLVQPDEYAKANG